HRCPFKLLQSGVFARAHAGDCGASHRRRDAWRGRADGEVVQLGTVLVVDGHAGTAEPRVQKASFVVEDDKLCAVELIGEAHPSSSSSITIICRRRMVIWSATRHSHEASVPCRASNARSGRMLSPSTKAA